MLQLVSRSRFLFALLALLATPARSDAFYDPAAFAAPALDGGGGGRFFTGSPADGQTCETCHTGARPPGVDVSGLPARYVPGATYELLVSWSAELGDVGATLELTDERGRGAGSLALPPAAEIRDEELCEPRNLQLLGTSLFDAEEGRSIASSGGCGATAMRVQWTAPKANVGLVWFAGAIVASNQQGDVEGDGVTTFIASVPPFSRQSSASRQHGCDVLHSTGESTFLPSWTALALGLLLVRRRRKQRLQLYAYVAVCTIAACGHESLLDPGEPRSKGPVTLHAGDAVDAWDAGEPALDSGTDTSPVNASAEAGADGQAPALPPFHLRLTTLAQGGAFAPKNVGAIWVEDSNGKWVKTLATWTGITLRYLSRYIKANPTGNTVDAVTSATLNAHEEHTVDWNLSDAKGAPLPDGTYHVLVEVTDRNGPGQMLDLEFSKGAEPQQIAPADSLYFKDVELSYEPPAANTATGDP